MKLFSSRFPAWLMAFSAALLVAALKSSAGVTVGAGIAVSLSTYQPMLNSNGALVIVTGKEDEGLVMSATAGEIHYHNQVLRLTAPQFKRIENAAPRGGAHPAAILEYTYQWATEPGLTVVIRHSVTNNHGAAVWLRNVEIRDTAPLVSDLTVSLQSVPGLLPTNTWLPMANGTGAAWGTNAAAVYHLAGMAPSDGVALALPMVSIPIAEKTTTSHPSANRGSDVSRIVMATDPYFTTEFSSNAIEWTYPMRGGLENGCEHRTIAVATHKGSIEDSLACFFNVALPDVQPGPTWLHDIALVDFDYLSKGGQGWFRDIDALTAALSKKDRHQALFCLHGWYDFLGRYCYTPEAGKLDQEWTSFSNWEAARGKHPFGTIGGTKVPMGFEECKPVKMSIAEVHRRLQYARSRGYRVGFYYADGVNAGDGLPGFDPTHVLKYGGWQGPDSKGKSYFQNPLEPQVHAFFIGYTKALLDEYGSEIDALVWDETFHVRAGQLGTEAFPGYADRAMMRLVHDVTKVVDDYNREHHRQIALLSSDDLGMSGDVPCALVAHGTYQDSWCNPEAWSYGIFANYRNVLWSCCWWHKSKWDWVDFGVRNYQAPVSITDGWGDDKGFSELTPEEQGRIIKLFNWRKHHRTQLKWFEKLPE